MFFAKVNDWVIYCIFGYFSKLNETSKYRNNTIMKGDSLAFVIIDFLKKPPESSVDDIGQED
jgi:hypothetical protein